MKQEEIEELLLHQLRQHWLSVDATIIHSAIPNALQSTINGFNTLKEFKKCETCGADIPISPYISRQWMIFLYRLSHEIFKSSGILTPKEADQIYYLNKILHSNDWFYAIDLPTHFLCEHPLGSVLGRAKYGDYFFVYQGTTVGGNRKNGCLYYPVIGENVILFANSTVLGNTYIGNNVVVSANTYIINENIPDNCIVFGRSPNLVVISRSEKEIKQYTQHIWGW